MLCMQQCIDMCELTAEEALAVNDDPSLHDILAIKAACSRLDGDWLAAEAEFLKYENCEHDR